MSLNTVRDGSQAAESNWIVIVCWPTLRSTCCTNSRYCMWWVTPAESVFLRQDGEVRTSPKGPKLKSKIAVRGANKSKNAGKHRILNKHETAIQQRRALGLEQNWSELNGFSNYKPYITFSGTLASLDVMLWVNSILWVYLMNCCFYTEGTSGSHYLDSSSCVVSCWRTAASLTALTMRFTTLDTTAFESLDPMILEKSDSNLILSELVTGCRNKKKKKKCSPNLMSSAISWDKSCVSWFRAKQQVIYVVFFFVALTACLL